MIEIIEVVGLNISVHKLLGKIEEELAQAKLSESEAHIRERIHAVKTLCELLLEEQPGQAKQVQVASSPAYIPAQVVSPPKMKLDKEANGDSLFDF